MHRLSGVFAYIVCCVTLMVGVNASYAQTQGYLMNEWSRTFRELGIVPIFPPREDVQIGDIYVHATDPESRDAEARLTRGDRLVGIGPRWASIDFREEINRSYEGRPSMAKTGSFSLPPNPSDMAAAWPQPEKPADSVPGGRVQFVSISNSTIGLRRVWERPIAIGFRGLVLEVDKATGLVFNIGLAHSAVPK
jgi:hypothetical protein